MVHAMRSAFPRARDSFTPGFPQMPVVPIRTALDVAWLNSRRQSKNRVQTARGRSVLRMYSSGFP